VVLSPLKVFRERAHGYMKVAKLQFRLKMKATCIER